jgi:uncharacterized membrane protein
MTFGQILDRTYKVCRANIKLFLSIASVPSVAVLVMLVAIFACMAPMIFSQIAAAQASDGAPPSLSPGMLPSVFAGVLLVVLYPLIFAVSALYMPAASYAATQADRGVKVTFGNAYRVARTHFWRYLWLLVLPALYVIVPLIVIAIIVGVGAVLLHLGNSNTDPATMFFLIPLVGLLYLGLIVYCILLMLRFALAYPASVEEGLTAWGALQRSASLTKGAKGRIFLVLLVVYAVMYAVNLVFIMAFMFVAAIVGGIALMAHVSQGSPAFFILIGLAALGYVLVLVACTTISYAAYTTTLAVVYHDQRLRKDSLPPATPQLGEAV